MLNVLMIKKYIFIISDTDITIDKNILSVWLNKKGKITKSFY